MLRFYLNFTNTTIGGIPISTGVVAGRWYFLAWSVYSDGYVTLYSTVGPLPPFVFTLLLTQMAC